MATTSSRALWTAKLLGKPVRGASARAKNLTEMPVRTRFRGMVLGIDPSLRGTGLAVVCFRESDQGKLLLSQRVSNAPKVSFSACLGEIFSAVDAILERFAIDAVALEATIYVQNFRTAQILGAARGAAIAAAAVRALPVSEYAPLRVKQAVVGHGRASKEQVARMMTQMLGLAQPLSLDETDAVAVALCHAFAP